MFFLFCFVYFCFEFGIELYFLNSFSYLIFPFIQKCLDIFVLFFCLSLSHQRHCPLFSYYKFNDFFVWIFEGLQRSCYVCLFMPFYQQQISVTFFSFLGFLISSLSLFFKCFSWRLNVFRVFSFSIFLYSFRKKKFFKFI